MYKICSKCGIKKDISNFYKKSNSKDGHRFECKTCYKQYESSKYKNINRQIKIKKEKKGYIYVLESNGIYKIGKTVRSVNKRIEEFRTGNPYSITLIYEYITNYINFDEYILHQNFKNKHFRGEWFNLDKEDLVFIEKYFIC